jgi:signal transduction histidine kinase/CheY-like chemotaxis protein
VLLLIIFISLAIIFLIAAGLFYVHNRKLKQENALLIKEAEQAKNTLLEHERYLAYTSHELRTPLNAIAGGAQLLSKLRLDDKQKKYVDTIQASVDSALLIVNDVLDLAKLDSNMVEIRSVNFMISELISGIHQMLSFRAEQKGIQFITDIDKNIPPVICGDAKHLNQILINLTTNAIKFTDIGKVELKVSIVSEDAEKIKLRFEVIDTGKGIRKSNLSTIFNQYQQETRHTIKHSGGTGLGLAITKKLVELQNGTIDVKSQYLEGTTFTVEITYEKTNEKTEQQQNANTNPFEKLGNIKILAVDDNLINREILHDLLKEANNALQIELAEDGEDAIIKMQKESFDVVLMDLQMPKKNGYEVCQYIRKNMKYPRSETPIIAMTAHALENVAESCFKAGMNDYIAKPIDINLLGNKILNQIQKKWRLNEKLQRFKYVDLEHLQELTKDNKERILKYINIFLQNLPDELEILKQHALNKDYKSIRESIHKIKGIVAYMGIKSLSRLFSSTEYAKLEQLNDNEMKLYFAEIEQTCNKAIEELKMIQQEI